MMFPIQCNSVLNNWHFLGNILRLFLSKAFNKSSNFAICTLSDGVKSNKSYMTASQCFLLGRHFKITFIYDCQIEGEMFNPIGILWYMYDILPKYGNNCSIFLNLLKALMNEMCLSNLILKEPNTWVITNWKCIPN